jgi:hypothetical protein
VVEPGAEDQPGEAVPVLMESAHEDGPLLRPAVEKSPRISDPVVTEEPSRGERLRSAMRRYLNRAEDRSSQ